MTDAQEEDFNDDGALFLTHQCCIEASNCNLFVLFFLRKN